MNKDILLKQLDEAKEAYRRADLLRWDMREELERLRAENKRLAEECESWRQSTQLHETNFREQTGYIHGMHDTLAAFGHKVPDPISTETSGRVFNWTGPALKI